MSETLTWLDAETTGPNPWTTGDHLLQVAGLFTDLEGEQIGDPFEFVIRYPAAEAAQLREHASEYVQQMHDRTGLWSRLPDGLPAEDVDREVLQLIKQVAPQPRTTRLAGNSVRLDLNFVEQFLPRTYAHLHYRSVDVSAVEYALHSWKVIPGWYDKKHTHTTPSTTFASLSPSTATFAKPASTVRR